MTIEQEMALLKYHNRLYHTGRADPEDWMNPEPISDLEYDRLYRSVKAFNPRNTDVAVPYPLPDRLSTHGNAMFAPELLENSQDVRKWIFDNCPAGGDIVVMPLVDGVPVVIKYTDGMKRSVASQGNGVIGEDVSDSMVLIRNCPDRLDWPVKIDSEVEEDVIGDAVIPISKIPTLPPDVTSLRSYARDLLFGNRTHRDFETRSPVMVWAYDTSKRGFRSFSDRLGYLKSLGFSIPDWYTASNTSPEVAAEEVFAYANLFKSKIRDGLDYDVDGVVMVVDDLEYCGGGGIATRKAMLKFTMRCLCTTSVNGFRFGVDENGRSSPSLEFNAPINNPHLLRPVIPSRDIQYFTEMMDRGLFKGAVVEVGVGNDNIPFVSNVITAEYGGGEILCPACKRVMTYDGTNLFCTFNGCRRRSKNRVGAFLKAVGSISQSVISDFVKNDRIPSLMDAINPPSPECVSWWLNLPMTPNSRKTIEDIYRSLKNIRDIPLSVFIEALDLTGIGATLSRRIAEKASTVENLVDMPYIKAFGIKGMGRFTAETLIDELRMRRKEILNLASFVGVLPKQEPTYALGGALFAITGVFDGYLIKAIEELVIDNGGRISPNVLPHADFVIAGRTEENNAALRDAKEFNVPIIGIEDLLIGIEDLLTKRGRD